MTAESYRDRWDALLKRIGAYALADKIRRRELYRLFDRKYPYDSTGKAVSVDVLEYLPDQSPDPLEQLIMRESTEAYLRQLTPAQQVDVKLYMDGYKPRDLAKSRGKDKSNAERWQKHNAKERIARYMQESRDKKGGTDNER